MGCEVCGKGTELVKAVIEGTVLNVCGLCASYGKIIEERKIESVKTKEVRIGEGEEVLQILVDDYSEKIKKAREKKDLTQDKLAEALAEKESVIHNLEAGHLRPNDKLVKKLEQFLHIKLLTEYKLERDDKNLDFKDDSLTIGDILKMKDEQKST